MFSELNKISYSIEKIDYGFLFFLKNNSYLKYDKNDDQFREILLYSNEIILKNDKTSMFIQKDNWDKLVMVLI